MNRKKRMTYTQQVVDMLDGMQELGAEEKKQIAMDIYRYYLDIYNTEKKEQKIE